MSGTVDFEGWQLRTAEVAQAIRRRVLAHVVAHNGGYLSQACSSAEILAALYTRVMRLGPSQGPLHPEPFEGVPGPGRRPLASGGRYNGPRAPELDRFFFSPVHYALALYATLVEVGRLAPEALQQFNRDGSTVEMIGAEHSPGIETMAGSLAQTLSQAAGVAMARKLRGERGRVWVFMSDGELQEGQSWEAFAAASHHQLDRLGVYIDANGQQCDGAMAGVLGVEPLADRLRAFGAEVHEVDGHDVAALAAAGTFAPGTFRAGPVPQGAPGSPAAPGRAASQPAGPASAPRVVVCRTDPCRGVELLRARAPGRIHHVRFVDAAERERYAALLAGLDAGGGR